MRLKDKIALVTGSSRGIGKAIALDLAREGAQVIVHGPAATEELNLSFEQVKAINPQSIKIAAELSDSKAIARMFEIIKKTYTSLDILVNNAATQNPGPFLDLKEKDWNHVLAVNLKAPFLCGQHAGRIMRENGCGKIINISSVHAYDVRRNYIHYSSSKGGLETLTKGMALELAEYNIQVNSIVVGAIATDLTPADRCENLITAIPAGRVGREREIAHLVTFLSSDACDYLTGTSITVDGGLTLGFCASRPDL
ncbi:MAG: SDR family oxidoreductase [Bacteroidota bacterium]|nr:SDR family oxidoreductase [Bacteroidota bacterium]